MNRQIYVFIIGLVLMTGFVLPVAVCDVYVWKDNGNIRHISNVKPKWWTDDMDQMDPGSVIAPESENAILGKFIGDRENKKFHWPKCEQIYNQQGILAIPEQKRIWFDTFDEAVSQGYHICDHCKPVKDGPEYKPKTP